MLYRLALVQHHGMWVVHRILHTRIQPDRKTTGIFVRDHLGPTFTHLDQAYKHMQNINQLLHRIESQDVIINDPHEHPELKLQSKSARASLIRELYALTGQTP